MVWYVFCVGVVKKYLPIVICINSCYTVRMNKFNNKGYKMTVTQIELFEKFTQEYTTELKNIDSMINAHIISYAEYRKLISDARSDYDEKLQELGL